MESKGPRVFFVAHVGCVVVVQKKTFFFGHSQLEELVISMDYMAQKP